MDKEIQQESGDFLKVIDKKWVLPQKAPPVSVADLDDEDKVKYDVDDPGSSSSSSAVQGSAGPVSATPPQPPLKEEPA